MKIGKVAFVLIFMFLLFACATQQGYDNKLDSLLGASKEQIISSYGRPSAVKIINDNTEILAYTKIDEIFVPSEFYTYDQGNEIYGQDALFSPFLSNYLFSDNPAGIGYNADYICKTLFLLQNNHVTAWKWQGNNCVAN